ncbi:MAG TPA: ABC transporter ATP-binding protein [Pantanalinema sp.]
MRRQLRRIAGLAWPHRGRYALGFGALLVTDLGNLGIPWLIGQFIDAARARGIDAAGALRFGLMVLGVAIVVAVFRYAWRMAIFGTARTIEFALRERFFKHLLSLSSGFYQRRTIGDLMAHATNDLNAIRGLLGEGVMAGFDTTIMLALTVVTMAGAIDWRLTLAAMIPLPVLALIQWRLASTIHHRFKEVQATFGTLSERVQENLSGVRVVKAFVQEAAEEERFGAVNQAYYDRYMHMTRLQALTDPMITFLSGLSAVIALGYGGSLVMSGELSLGRFIAFNSYLGMLVWPMLALGWVVNLAQRATASMERIQAILDEVPEVRDGAQVRAPQRIEGGLSIRDLTFRYAPDLPSALDGLSVQVPPGKTLGLIGRTGSGKTTLANLLVRAYDPPAGTVLLDGHDVNDLSLSALRGAIAYVPQDAFLFSDTLEANVAFDPAPHDAGAVRAAAAAAQLEGEIDAMPRGFSTVLGERGITLSGGQRQRVGIARALLKHASVLVLDDCLSAVDTHTEARLLSALKRHAERRTTIIASHRVSALQHADEILLLEAGRVIERGTHAELLALGGEYRRIYERQALEATLATEDA